MSWISPEFSLHHNVKYTNPNLQFQGPPDFLPNEINPQIPDLTEQKKSDEKFINNFLSNLKKNKESESKNIQLNISEAKILLYEIIKEKSSLEKETDLNVNDDNFDSNLEALLKRRNNLNEKLVRFQTEIKSPLKKLIERRKKKRNAIRKKKMKYKALKEEMRKEIEQKHKVIDKLLNERLEEVEDLKREAALKRQADSVLHEVRRKKYEGKKMLSLLMSLAKLRELRSKREEERGGYCSKQLTETFNQVMDRFQKLWQKQIEMYKLEEKGLKIMLEETALPSVKESKFEMNILEWEKALFGDVLSTEYERFLAQPEVNIEALIQVRKDWDQFLTNETAPMASSIPLGWVLPPASENEDWKMFTKTDKKFSL